MSVARGAGAATGKWRVQAASLAMNLNVAATRFLPPGVFLSIDSMDLVKPATSRKCPWAAAKIHMGGQQALRQPR